MHKKLIAMRYDDMKK